jgi:TRAP-type mannitol/chloroaromatic compound transport system permease small subunit
MLPLLGWLAWMLLEYLVTGYTRGERSGQSSLNPPVWPFRLVFTVSFALLALQVFVSLVKSLSRLTTPNAAR